MTTPLDEAIYRKEIDGLRAQLAEAQRRIAYLQGALDEARRHAGNDNRSIPFVPQINPQPVAPWPQNDPWHPPETGIRFTMAGRTQ